MANIKQRAAFAKDARNKEMATKKVKIKGKKKSMTPHKKGSKSKFRY